MRALCGVLALPPLGAVCVTIVSGEAGVGKRLADIGSRRQSWFNTQGLIARTSLLTAFQNRPRKHPKNPLTVADRPWEGTLAQLHSPDVHYDAEARQWRMGYEGHPGEVLICMARSTDGLHWTKPTLGLQTWKGHKKANIVLQTGYSDAHRRYALLFGRRDDLRFEMFREETPPARSERSGKCTTWTLAARSCPAAPPNWRSSASASSRWARATRSTSRAGRNIACGTWARHR